MRTLKTPRRASLAMGALLAGGLLLIPAAPLEAQAPSRQGDSSSRPSASAPSRSSSPPPSRSAGSSSSSGSSRSSGSVRPSSPSRNSGGGRTAVRPSAPNRSGRQVEVSDEDRSRLPTAGGSSSANRSRSHDRYYSNDYHHHHYRGCGHYGYGYGRGYYYPHRYYPYRYYGPYGYVYYPYGYGAYPHGRYGGYGGYGGYAYDANAMGALDLDVRPEKAQIYINGTPIGVADQYDGFPAYLWLEKGTYDVVIYKEGYQTISRQYTIYPGVVIDVNDRMVRGESRRPEELISKSTVNRDERLRRDREARERAAEAQRSYGGSAYGDSGYDDGAAGSAPAYGSEPAPAAQDPEGVGRLLLQVLPADVAVYLDGHFLGTGGELAQLSAGLLVEPGDHVLELVRPGYQTERVPITVPPGERVDLDLELQRR